MPESERSRSIPASLQSEVNDAGFPSKYAPLPDDMATPIAITITKLPGPDCRPPRQYPYDGGVP